jgi:hypothetical protein
MDAFHTPVMVHEVVASLLCRAGTITVDGTVGGGGHAEAILKNTAPDGILIGIDADADALGAARERLARFGGRAILVKGNFAHMETILEEEKVGKVDGILLDLGVSSHQLDKAERGFSFAQDAPLDMRMDRSSPKTASDLVNTLPWEELARIIRDYGEERMAGRIARAIVKERTNSPIPTLRASSSGRSLAMRNTSGSIPRPGPSRPSGSPSTTSSRAFGRPLPMGWSGSSRVGVFRSSHFIRWKTGSSRTPFAPGRRDAPVRPTFPSAPAAGSRN